MALIRWLWGALLGALLLSANLSAGTDAPLSIKPCEIFEQGFEKGAAVYIEKWKAYELLLPPRFIVRAVFPGEKGLEIEGVRLNFENQAASKAEVLEVSKDHLLEAMPAELKKMPFKAFLDSEIWLIRGGKLYLKAGAPKRLPSGINFSQISSNVTFLARNDQIACVGTTNRNAPTNSGEVITLNANSGARLSNFQVKKPAGDDKPFGTATECRWLDDRRILLFLQSRKISTGEIVDTKNGTLTRLPVFPAGTLITAIGGKVYAVSRTGVKPIEI